MLAKRIIACLDIRHRQVVKGIRFKQHTIVGDPTTLVREYSRQGVDELVVYDIAASSMDRIVDYTWISKIAAHTNVPLCVAGGIRSVEQARRILEHGADKISINSPALSHPELINQLAQTFGTQCVVIGIDSRLNTKKNVYQVHQYAGNPQRIRVTPWRTEDWINEVQARGAGEIVLNAMRHDGVRNGYDLVQLGRMKSLCRIPLVASGGAGNARHFLEVFQKTQCDAALAASVFHKKIVSVPRLKQFLHRNKVCVRLC